MEKSAVALCLTALAAPFMPTVAAAGPEYTAPGGGTFTFYGQLDFAIVDFDDGEHSDTDGADNSKSPSKFGFWIRQPFGDDELGFQFETALGFRPSSDMRRNDHPDIWSWDKKKLRRVDLSYRSARYGTFWIGQGSQASDGSGTTDLSGTTLVSDPGLGDYVGARYLHHSSGALTNVSMGDVFDSYDGSRYGRVRYDTPAFYNFTLGVSYGKNILNASDKNRYYDIALTYANTLDSGVKVAGGLGYKVTNAHVGRNLKDTFGSVSVLWPQGWNATLTAGTRDPDGSFYMPKIGYIAKDWLAWGSTALSVDYYHSSDMVTDGDSSDAYGFAVVQDIEQYDAQVYFGYRNYSYDDDFASYKDANTYVAGVNWSF